MTDATPISPELVLVDPALRERLFAEYAAERTLAEIEASHASHVAVDAGTRDHAAVTPPTVSPAPGSGTVREGSAAAQPEPTDRPRGWRSLRPSTVVVAALGLLLLVTGLLPPRNAPSFARNPEVRVALAWPRPGNASSYVVEILERGSLVWTDLVHEPHLDRDLALPAGREYVWRVYASDGPPARAGMRDPIAQGTLLIR
jgi:hypothetical protein